METQDTHARLPGEPARESLLLKAKVRDTETGTKESRAKDFWVAKGKINTKGETKSVGDTVCSWILTASHFSAKGNLASENTEIAPLQSYSPEEEKKMDLSEGLPRRCTIILEGMRPTNDKSRQCPAGSVCTQHALWTRRSAGSPALPSRQTLPAAMCVCSPTGELKAKCMLLLGASWRTSWDP